MAAESVRIVGILIIVRYRGVAADSGGTWDDWTGTPPIVGSAGVGSWQGTYLDALLCNLRLW